MAKEDSKYSPDFTSNSKPKLGDYVYDILTFGGGSRTATWKVFKDQKDLFYDKMDAIYEATIRKGSKLSDKELKEIIGSDNYHWWRDDKYDQIYDEYYAEVIAPNLDNAIAQRNQDTALAEVQALRNAFGPTTNELGLNADLQRLLDARNQASQMQYDIAMQELNRAEQEMFRATGMAQRQMERDIAKRRQQALKSGMSTAQLAAQEQQNILAAQSGAAQIAQQYADQRYNTINQFAGYASQNYADVLATQSQYNQDWNNKLADTYAQIYAANKMENKQ